ncbi:hypothetical protein FNF29_03810 [Cafeteria roenbergensis]|uniref:IPT/TIG domain-containing protein n=1 Tax=Cafeteria roenbergensis TaxID=33653 RepID=A0A5A8CHQ9_CAFRO|nr:hypothetical protein FNF29_03810 [Cafeteria roenbergensis]|eukprot:KAA0152583.1 hypothetical protein FNF29_03810 [Cafeteria roenbergensis]
MWPSHVFMPKLEVLTLSSAVAIESLPGLQQQVPKLKKLTAVAGRLKVLPWLGQLPDLEAVTAARNPGLASAEQPVDLRARARFSTWPSLSSVDLSEAGFRSVPLAFARAAPFELLDLQSNPLGSGHCSECLADVFGIRGFGLFSTPARRVVLDHAFKLPSLPVWVAEANESLSVLFANNVSLAYLPQELCQLQELRELRVDMNWLEELPVCIAHMSRLTTIKANFNLLHNIPDFQAEVERQWLTTIATVASPSARPASASAPPLASASPSLPDPSEDPDASPSPAPSPSASPTPSASSVPQALPSLASLELGWNSLTRDDLVRAARLVSLSTLNMQRNQIHGTIPSSMAQMSSLQWCDLSHNSLVSFDLFDVRPDSAALLEVADAPMSELAAAQLQLPLALPNVSSMDMLTPELRDTFLRRAPSTNKVVTVGIDLSFNYLSGRFDEQWITAAGGTSSSSFRFNAYGNAFEAPAPDFKFYPCYYRGRQRCFTPALPVGSSAVATSVFPPAVSTSHATELQISGTGFFTAEGSPKTFWCDFLSGHEATSSSKRRTLATVLSDTEVRCSSPPHQDLLGKVPLRLVDASAGAGAWGGITLRCPEGAIFMWLLLVFVAFVVTAGLIAMSKPSDSKLYSPQIGIGFVQIVSLYANLTVRWPPLVVSSFSYASVVNLNLDLFSPECSIQMDFWRKYAFKLALPAAAAVVFALHDAGVFVPSGPARGSKSKSLRRTLDPAAYERLRIRMAGMGSNAGIKVAGLPASKGAIISDDQSDLTGESVQREQLAASVVSLSSGQVAVTRPGGERWVIDAFWLALLPQTQAEIDQLESLEFSGTPADRLVYAAATLVTVAYTFLSATAIQAITCVPSGSKLVLKAETTVGCFEGDYWDWFPLVLGVNLVYTVGAPILVAVVLLAFKRQGKLHTPQFEARFGVLTLPFTRHAWWWTIVDMGRKLGMVLVVAYGSDGTDRSDSTVTQIVAAVIISLSIGLLRLMMSPYRLASLNRAAGVTSLAEIFILFNGVIFQSGQVSALTLDILAVVTAVLIAVALAVVAAAAVAEVQRNRKRMHVLGALGLTSYQLDAMVERLFFHVFPHNGESLFREWTQWEDDQRDALLKDVVALLALTPAKGLNPFAGAADAFAKAATASACGPDAAGPPQGRVRRRASRRGDTPRGQSSRSVSRVEWTGSRVEVVEYMTNPLARRLSPAGMLPGARASVLQQRGQSPWYGQKPLGH